MKKLLIKFRYAKMCIYINDLKDHLNELIISLITETLGVSFIPPNFYGEHIHFYV
jgi:hypothetical protein